jgi:tetratricopeptide (TPR) repeat protein/SAM-dependent methyltransferase
MMAAKNRRASDFKAAEAASLFARAVQAHQAGQLPHAEQLYRQLLAADPKHIDGLHLLGVLAQQSAHHEAALDLISRAIALNPRVPEFHYNIGLAYGALGRFDEAAAHNRRAVALRPDYVEAHRNLGNALNAQGQPAQALESYHRALALRPAPDLHFNIANVLAARGDDGEAIAHYREALALHPDYADAHNNLGVALALRGEHAEAAACFRRALALRPDLPGAALGLANMLLAQGDLAGALAVAKRLHGQHESAETRALLFLCLRDPRATPFASSCRAELIRALSEPWGDPRALTGLAADLLQQDAAIGPLIERAAGAAPLTPDDLAMLAGDALLRATLESVQINQAGLERLLTQTRRALLDVAEVTPDPASARWLDLAGALAQQCFITEYAFAVSEDEAARVGALREVIAQPAAATPLRLALLACYAPLHALPDAQTLARTDWPPAIQTLMVQQIAEPAEQARLRDAIPRLTAISDNVSQAVRAQYEENPYPRWTRTAPLGPPKSLDAYLADRCPQRYRPLGKDPVDYLIAGCGTGRQVAGVKQSFSGVTVTAIDLSLSSLAYAKHKTDALGLTDISYGQADILELGTLGKSFDVIDSAGVLHHMGDPLTGWRVLLSLLRPGGVMRIALYSTLARRDIAATRSWIAAQGYAATADGIRAARQAILAQPAGTPARNVAALIDFFSLSDCRDLLFHVQEHTFGIPAIAAFLAAEGLEFLGFEVAADVAQRYAARFPGDRSKTNLDNWNAFEQDNPDTFIATYQFWTRAEPASAR